MGLFLGADSSSYLTPYALPLYPTRMSEGNGDCVRITKSEVHIGRREAEHLR